MRVDQAQKFLGLEVKLGSSPHPRPPKEEGTRRSNGRDLKDGREKARKPPPPSVSHFHASIPLPGSETRLTGQENAWLQNATVGRFQAFILC